MFCDLGLPTINTVWCSFTGLAHNVLGL